ESRPNNGKPTIKGFNFLQQTSDLKDLWIIQNGAALPYDATMEYAEGAVVVKDGELQKKQGASWVSTISKSLVRSYLTLDLANADIANIAPGVQVQTGDQGLWYKATAEATSLTKSPYDPIQQGKKTFLNAFETYD